MGEKIKNTLPKLLESINSIYGNKNKKSISEILDSFRQISEDYNEFNNTQINRREYSSYIYDECSEDERIDFYIDQLENIKCLVINSIYEHVGMIWNFGDIYELMHQDSYQNIDKINRKVLYSTFNNNRPVGENSYGGWNGFQTIDLDIKDEYIASELKPRIFDELKQFNWFLGVCKSASGKGLHIWTKINPISEELKNKKIEYLCNFRHKYSYVYVVLNKYSKELNYTKDDIMSYLDMAMSKPQQGAFISSDNKALLNTNFIDLRLDVGFESAFNNGIESIDWISHVDLKQIFAKLDWFNNDTFVQDVNVDMTNITNINERDISKSLGRRHYKHAQRWQLANTLCSLYGYDKALSLMNEICLGTSYRELAGDVKTASIHNKPISLWAVKNLNKYHGFKLEIKKPNIYTDELKKVEEEIKEKESDAIDPIKILNDKTNHITLNMTYKQYLSDIKDDILKNLGKITLLEAGAGYGKTEMIKSLKARTLLILPFTSTIKAKVEASEVTKDWLYYYGNKRPTIDDLFSGKNMSMTIDKFSKLNVMELDHAKFEYIVIDESHLLFTSSYREVMSPCIQRLANCKAKIIMMTGTPTGELLFFPNIKHIKVVKEDFREKIFECHMCESKYEQLINMAESMGEDIISGKKILYPTNKGNLYFEQVTGLIQKYLDQKHPDKNHQLKAFYYKKSNVGDESMDNINIDKSIGTNDIIFCTTYLSVGVDICDRYIFSVYFNERWIPQDIEQFANRLRNNDLYIKMFLPKKDSTGFPINYLYTENLNLDFDKKDLLLCRDMIKTCNDMLERNQEESKYSPFIASILASNKCLKYDENDVKYYIDETTYKLKVFEERYSEYSKQLQVMLNGIRYYGYKVEIIDHPNIIPDSELEIIEEELKACRHLRYNYIKNETFAFLEHLNDGNIDVYKDLMRGGSYDIFKSNENKYVEDRINNNLYCRDIEIIEKNIPIVVGLYKFYDCETIKDIFEYCVDKKQNRINYTKLDRIRKFILIEYNRQKNRLDFPVYKFMVEAKKWTLQNTNTTIDEIKKWLANFAAKFGNSIPDVLVDNIDYLDRVYELIEELWNVITIQTRPKNGNVTITPFELLWEKKTSLFDDFNGDKLTKEFFLQELLDNIKSDENDKELEIIKQNEEELPELPHTQKLQIKDIENELPNIIHSGFEYDNYSKLDGSNDRFLRKQENTNSLRDKLFDGLQESSNDENIQLTKQPIDLFNQDNMLF